MKSSNIVINSSPILSGQICIPGDKSITHRAIILGSLADGDLTIHHPLLAHDCLKTLNIFKQLGVKIEIDDKNLIVRGRGLTSLNKPSEELDAGNSGTLMRLLTGVLCAQNFSSTIIGDKSLCQRPMDRIINPLSKMGAQISSKDGLPSLTIQSVEGIKAIDYKSPIASAQIKSCLLLCGMFAKGETIVTEAVKTRDHTESLLKYLDYPVQVDGNKISIKGLHAIKPKDIFVPSDISSAAFFIVAALIKKGSDVIFKNIGINPLRTGILDVLIDMGANITITNKHISGSELVADLRVKSSTLQPTKVSGSIVSRLIDEFPILFIACTSCHGVSEFSDIAELRNKESDRISSMEKGLMQLGITVQSTANSISIKGGVMKGGIVDSFDDHRVAMSFIIAGLISDKPITVLNTSNINTSFPNFFSNLKDQNIETYLI